MNWLRAGVLGANDGIISISVLLLSVVGVLSYDKLLIVGLSGILGGALSMAIGEYVSVSAQRDAEKSAKRTELTNPFHAGISSLGSFIFGAAIPLGAALLFENTICIVLAVLLALTITTIVSVKVGKTGLKRPLLRNILGGGLALALGVLLNTVFSGI